MTTDALPTEEIRTEPARTESLIPYFLLGVYLGIVFIKSQVASWFRIQEMFRFQSIHMYGIIGGAVVVGAIGVALLKRAGARTMSGEPIVFPDPDDRKPALHHALGGAMFGLGWGLVGACPGPIYALLGSGLPIMLVVLGGAAGGAWVYGFLRPKLPH
jgi:uncharacterized membrane protein YedE/YeeE